MGYNEVKIRNDGRTKSIAIPKDIDRLLELQGGEKVMIDANKTKGTILITLKKED